MTGEATFTRFANTPDPGGDQAFAAKVGHKGVGLKPGVDPEAHLPWPDLKEEDRAFITLMKLPRRFKDLADCGAVPHERAVQLIRALVSADMAEAVEADRAKALIPVEVRKALAAQKGQQLVTRKLVANIYRPGLDDPPPVASSAPAAAAPPPARAVPAPIEGVPAPPPAPRVPTENTAEFAAIRKEVDEAHARLKGMDHFQVMGLDRAATDDKVKTAYIGLVRKWHPDRLASASGPQADETRRKLEQLFAALGEANRVLSDRGTRTAYLEDLKKREMSGTPAAAVHKGPPIRAEDAKMHAQMGKVYARKQDWPSAQKEFKLASNMDPGLVEYRVEYAWAFLMNGANGPEDGRRRTVRDLLREAVKDSKYADGHFKLGLLHRMMGEPVAAEAAFRKAHQLDKRHAEAAREVRLLDLRGEKARKATDEENSGGAAALLGKLLGRGKTPASPASSDDDEY